MTSAFKKRLLRTAVLSLIALVIGMGAAWMQIRAKNATALKQEHPVAFSPLAVAGVGPGGPFTLTDQDGYEVTESSLQGHYSLLYFGFTYCPAICPTELQKISRVMKMLEKDSSGLAEKMQLFFITIDPERDTAAVMKDYVPLFHPRLKGLTGTPAQIEEVKKAYYVFAQKAPTEDGADYTMDHTSYIYLMGPDGTLKAIYRTKDTADFIYANMRDILEQGKE